MLCKPNAKIAPLQTLRSNGMFLVARQIFCGRRDGISPIGILLQGPVRHEWLVGKLHVFFAYVVAFLREAAVLRFDNERLRVVWDLHDVDVLLWITGGTFLELEL